MSQTNLKHATLETNPNNITWNLTSRTLSVRKKFEVLHYGLNHGLATHENKAHQISRNNLCKETHTNNKRAKNLLRALAFNLINLDNY